MGGAAARGLDEAATTPHDRSVNWNWKLSRVNMARALSRESVEGLAQDACVDLAMYIGQATLDPIVVIGQAGVVET